MTIPGKCVICGHKLPPPKSLGRPRTRCVACVGKRLPPRKVPTRQGPLRQAAEETLGALEAKGCLGPTDASRISQFRGLASALDANPRSAPLWREFRLSEAALRLSGAASGEVDAYRELMESLGGDS